MNDRIVELMVKASSGACYDETTPTLYGTEIEKFAELIVGECGVALSPMLRDMISRGKAFDLIKEHFGVKLNKREKFDQAMQAAFANGVDLSGKETP